MAISQKVKKEYLALVAELNKHNDLYHNQDSPEISDQEYDQLFKKLLVLESEFPNIKAINVKQTAAIKILIATKIKGDKLSRAIETLMKEAPQIAERMINNIQLIKPGL